MLPPRLYQPVMTITAPPTRSECGQGLRPRPPVIIITAQQRRADSGTNYISSAVRLFNKYARSVHSTKNEYLPPGSLLRSFLRRYSAPQSAVLCKPCSSSCKLSVYAPTTWAGSPHHARLAPCAVRVFPLFFCGGFECLNHHRTAYILLYAFHTFSCMTVIQQNVLARYIRLYVCHTTCCAVSP